MSMMWSCTRWKRPMGCWNWRRVRLYSRHIWKTLSSPPTWYAESTAVALSIARSKASQPSDAPPSNASSPIATPSSSTSPRPVESPGSVLHATPGASEGTMKRPTLSPPVRAATRKWVASRASGT